MKSQPSRDIIAEAQVRDIARKAVICGHAYRLGAQGWAVAPIADQAQNKTPQTQRVTGRQSSSPPPKSTQVRE